MGQLELRTEIDVDASPEAVWGTLSDFAGYSLWNPMVVSAVGEAAEGEGVSLTYRSSLGLRLSFRVRVTRVEPGRELRWLGRRLGVSGDHYFQLEPNGRGGTRLVHGEIFRGLLVRPFAFGFERQRPVFEAFNEALGRQAQRRGGRAQSPR